MVLNFKMSLHFLSQFVETHKIYVILSSNEFIFTHKGQRLSRISALSTVILNYIIQYSLFYL